MAMAGIRSLAIDYGKAALRRMTGGLGHGHGAQPPMLSNEVGPPERDSSEKLLIVPASGKPFEVHPCRKLLQPPYF